MNLSPDTWVGVVQLVIYSGLLWMFVRWMWLTYKASKIVISFAESLREQEEAEKLRKELDEDAAKRGIRGEPKTAPPRFRAPKRPNTI